MTYLSQPTVVEAGGDDLARVDGGAELEVAIDVAIFDEFGGLGNPEFVIEDGHAERSNEVFFLHEGLGGIAFAIAYGLFLVEGRGVDSGTKVDVVFA
ncbi:hypothetical protein V2O64_18575 [Verrucomicrobiaceae bacterium 227]